MGKHKKGRNILNFFFKIFGRYLEICSFGRSLEFWVEYNARIFRECFFLSIYGGLLMFMVSPFLFLG